MRFSASWRRTDLGCFAVINKGILRGRSLSPLHMAKPVTVTIRSSVCSDGVNYMRFRMFLYILCQVGAI